MRRFVRLAAVYIALVAMAVRGEVPVGWMPSTQALGGTLLTICTVHGLSHVAIDLGGGSSKHGPLQDDSHRHDVCPFAAAVHLATPVGAAVVAALTHGISVAWPSVALGGALSRSRYTPQSPRGPPSFA